MFLIRFLRFKIVQADFKNLPDRVYFVFWLQFLVWRIALQILSDTNRLDARRQVTTFKALNFSGILKNLHSFFRIEIPQNAIRIWNYKFKKFLSGSLICNNGLINTTLIYFLGRKKCYHRFEKNLLSHFFWIRKNKFRHSL